MVKITIIGSGKSTYDHTKLAKFLRTHYDASNIQISESSTMFDVDDNQDVSIILTELVFNHMKSFDPRFQMIAIDRGSKHE